MDIYCTEFVKRNSSNEWDGLVDRSIKILFNYLSFRSIELQVYSLDAILYLLGKNGLKLNWNI